MGIPEPTVRAMLQTVREAAFAADLPATLVSRLHGVVGADYVTYDDFRPDGTLHVADPVAPAEIGEAWRRFGHQHPSVPHCIDNPHPRVVRLSDVATQRELRSLELWDHVQRPLGIRYQLNVPLYQVGPRLIGVGLNRCRRDFSDHEVAVMEMLREELSRIVAAREAMAHADVAGAGLTEREQQALAWLVTGLGNKQIAEQMGLSARTVSKHLEAIYRKLGVSTRAAAIARARAHTSFSLLRAKSDGA